jgi:hypothetical protein
MGEQAWIVLWTRLGDADLPLTRPEHPEWLAVAVAVAVAVACP